MNVGKMRLSPRKVVQMREQTCQRRDCDIYKANNQVWSDLEGRLLEQTRPDWIITGT